jgi:3-dehydroquinate dehydratase-2
MKISIINGANLNLLGTREPEIYGNISFEKYFEELQKYFSDTQISYYQSNIEGEIVNFIQQAGQNSDAIIINAGGLDISRPSIFVCLTARLVRDLMARRNYL